MLYNIIRETYAKYFVNVSGLVAHRLEIGQVVTENGKQTFVNVFYSIKSYRDAPPLWHIRCGKYIKYISNSHKVPVIFMDFQDGKGSMCAE